MIKYKKGDLLKAEENIIAHGVNCVGGFGSGVAGQIAKRYPKVRKYYLDKFENKYDGWILGNIQVVYCSGKYFVNCATQKKYLPRGKLHANYDAIKTCMVKVRDWAKPDNLSIAIPKIGCGLAGGDWEIVEKILEDVFKDYNITVYEL